MNISIYNTPSNNNNILMIIITLSRSLVKIDRVAAGKLECINLVMLAACKLVKGRSRNTCFETKINLYVKIYRW